MVAAKGSVAAVHTSSPCIVVYDTHVTLSDSLGRTSRVPIGTCETHHDWTVNATNATKITIDFKQRFQWTIYDPCHGFPYALASRGKDLKKPQQFRLFIIAIIAIIATLSIVASIFAFVALNATNCIEREMKELHARVIVLEPRQNENSFPGPFGPPGMRGPPDPDHDHLKCIESELKVQDAKIRTNIQLVIEKLNKLEDDAVHKSEAIETTTKIDTLEQQPSDIQIVSGPGIKIVGGTGSITISNDGILSIVRGGSGGTITNSLVPGQTLKQGDKLCNNRNTHCVHVDEHCTISLVGDNSTWYFGGGEGDGPCELRFQKNDAKLVLYNKDNKAVWESGINKEKLTLDDDSILRLGTAVFVGFYNPKKRVNQTASTDSVPRLFKGEKMVVGNKLCTNVEDATTCATLTDDCDIMYQGKRIYALSSYRYEKGCELHMQQDGNLVLYNKHGHVLQSTNTHGSTCTHLMIDPQKGPTLVCSDEPNINFK